MLVCKRGTCPERVGVSNTLWASAKVQNSTLNCFRLSSMHSIPVLSMILAHLAHKMLKHAGLQP
jgi:hypothetical protein